MNATEFAKGIPTADPNCAECGGVGFAEIDGTCGSCETCMPPDFVARPNGTLRQGRRDLDGPPLKRMTSR